MSVYIYANEQRGVHPTCIEQIDARIMEYGVPSSEIVRLTDSSYLDRELEGKKQGGVLVIPGGRTSGMAKDLIRSIPKIKEAIRNGLNYLGYCAGGNLASERLLYRKDRVEMDLLGAESNLGLLPVVAKAPIDSWDEPVLDAPSGGKIVSIYTSSKDIKEFKSYWNEGSRFLIKQDHSGYLYDYFSNKPLLSSEGFYKDLRTHPIAAISGSYGRGRVSISGFHPEIDVGETGGGRVKFLHKMFRHVGLEPRKKSLFFWNLFNCLKACNRDSSKGEMIKMDDEDLQK
jgi:glutamine amidotransferase-like uncharacterized protein